MFVTLTAFQSGFYLHHLSFESQRPERLALFYSNVMDMDLNKQSDSEWRCEGPGRRIVFVPGENKKLAYAGLACGNIEGLKALRSRAYSENIKILECGSPYFEDGAFSLKTLMETLYALGLKVLLTTKGKQLRGPYSTLRLHHLMLKDLETFIIINLGLK